MFISHNASRSGAPIYFIRLISELKHRYNVSVLILLLEVGELEMEFTKAGKTFLLPQSNPTKSRKEGLLRKLYFREKQNSVIRKIKREKPDLIISNTIVSNVMADKLKAALSVPLIAIYHEMFFSASHYYPMYLQDKFLHAPDIFITINNHITYWLEKRIKPYQKIYTIPPFVLASEKVPNVSLEDKMVIGCSGYGGWGKGLDLIITLIASLKSKNIDRYFRIIWLGEIPALRAAQFAYEHSLLSTACIVQFPGLKDDTVTYYKQMHCFLSLSREDSCPLACLEAAQYALPIIAFEGSGGITEFISNEAGFVIPYADMSALCEKLEILLRNTKAREKLGNKAQQKVKAFSMDKILPQIVNVIHESGIEL